MKISNFKILFITDELESEKLFQDTVVVLEIIFSMDLESSQSEFGCKNYSHFYLGATEQDNIHSTD